jgi:hypothetical protein
LCRFRRAIQEGLAILLIFRGRAGRDGGIERQGRAVDMKEDSAC